MSVWRRKRRYEENRRFSERADAALLAAGILQNSANGVESSRSDEDIEDMLRDGRTLLEEMETALRTPEYADDYTFALAQKLCDSWKVVPEDAADQLSEDIETLRTAEQNLVAVSGLERVKETLTEVEEIAGRISEVEAQQMRNNLVN